MSKEYPLNVPAPHHFTFAVRDIPDVTVEQRERVLKATHYNEFAFPAGMLTVDMLSDSGTTAMTNQQSATRLTAATPVITFCSTPSATSSSAAARRTGRRSSTMSAPTAATWRP